MPDPEWNTARPTAMVTPKAQPNILAGIQLFHFIFHPCKTNASRRPLIPPIDRPNVKARWTGLVMKLLTPNGKLGLQRISFKNAPKSMPPNIESALDPVQNRMIVQLLGNDSVSVVAMITNFGLYDKFPIATKRPTIYKSYLEFDIDAKVRVFLGFGV